MMVIGGALAAFGAVQLFLAEIILSLLFLVSGAVVLWPGKKRSKRTNRVICPTGYHLAIYRGALDFRTGRWSHEETYEYHYADVVAVTTTWRAAPEVTLRADDPLGNRKAAVGTPSVLTFRISVSSNEKCAVEVGIWDDDNDGGAHPALRETGIDPVIDSVRRVLRDKKGGTAVVS